MEKIEIPPGLIRTWKAFVICAFGNIVFFLAGGWAGHSTARVETRIERVEVPWPDRCSDVMILVNDSAKEIRCTHPDQSGHFVKSLTSYDTYLMCSCPTPQISLEAGAR